MSKAKSPWQPPMRFSPLCPMLFVTEDGEVFKWGVKVKAIRRIRRGESWKKKEPLPEGER